MTHQPPLPPLRAATPQPLPPLQSAIPPPLPHSQALPPLRHLPPPPRIAADGEQTVLPQEILLESRAVIRNRLLRLAWGPLLVLVALWALLAFSYVFGLAPAMWFLSLLVGLSEPAFLGSLATSLGFSRTQLWLIALLVPTVGPLLSLPLLPRAARSIAAMNPRAFLSERAFQRAVADRAACAFIAPPVLAVALLALVTVTGLPVLHWRATSGGTLAGLAVMVLGLLLAWVSIRPIVSAPRILGVEPVERVMADASFGDADQRRAAARRVLAQDRRHLPPNPGTPQASAGLSLAGALRALVLILRSALTVLLPALAVLAWIVFSLADWVGVFASIGGPSSPGEILGAAIDRRLALLALPVGALVLAATALAPGVAVVLAKGARDRVLDERTYELWEHRSRVNLWEARVVSMTARIAMGIALVGSFGWGVLVELVGAQSALSATWTVLGVVLITPLWGASAMFAMRTGLRTVLYGPAGRYMRRDVPHALVAPEIGTRAELAKEPVVRAAMRERLRAEGGEHALEVFDLDDAGERLWVDESAADTAQTRVRGEDVSLGVLPDFGAGAEQPAAHLPGADDGAHAIPTALADEPFQR